MSSDDLERLRARVEEARRASSAAHDALIYAERDYRAAQCAAHPFQIGDTIRSETGRLARVDWLWTDVGEVRVSARLLRKDGTVSARKIDPFSPEWRSATLHQRAETSQKPERPI